MNELSDAPRGVENHAVASATSSSRFEKFRSKNVFTGKRLLRLGAQLLLLIALYGAGCLLAEILPFSLPGNILGMLLLLILLGAGFIKDKHVGDACDCLLDNMSLFFIPAGVAIMGCISLLEGNVVKFAVVCVVTTILVFLATAYTVIFVSRLMARSHKADKTDGEV